MTPAENPPDSPGPRRLLAGPVLALALLVGGALVLSGIGGCSKPPARTTEGQGGGGEKVEPWKVAAAKLQKETDFAAAKAALGALGAEKLPTTPEEVLTSGPVPLSPADREEIRGGAFSGPDAAYLADCFYLRDAARSLGLTGVPPERQADLAFAWVCRQVYVCPWLRRLDQQTFQTTALPPTAVLRRGSGSALERMYVFLALLQQLELDGCLIGGPTLAPVTADFRVNIAVETPQALAAVVAVAPRGPFWAVGVRVGNDVRLYDPWRGTAFPVTLNQLRANPDAAKGWFEDRANASGATLDDAKKATVYLAVPVNALSARMAAFEANLKGELGVKVAFDLKGLGAKRAAFPDPKPAFWNPPGEPFAYGRAARSYLPTDMGGSDSGPPGGRLYDASLREQVPAAAFAVPAGLEQTPRAVQRLREVAVGGLAGAFLEPPNPRERIQRGQFQDAARDLVAKQDTFANGLERLRLNRDADQQIRDWIVTANQLYLDLGAAQLDKNKEQEAAALAAIENHWKQSGAQLLVDQALSKVGRAEASLLLALCKHEQAERLQARLERATGAEAARRKADATDAWKTALSAWRTYEQVSSAHAGFPGRAAHALALAARAAALAADDAKK